MIPHTTASQDGGQVNAALSTQSYTLAFHGEKDLLQKSIFLSFSADLLQHGFAPITLMLPFSSRRASHDAKVRGNLRHRVLHLA
jgi:hypothetical protein